MRRPPLWSLALIVSLVAAAPAAKGPVARSIAPGRFVEWTPPNGARAWTAGGVTATVIARRGADGYDPVVTVSAPGMSPVRIAADQNPGSYPLYIGIGSLKTGDKPSVIVRSWTGGAHCCTNVQVATPAGKAYRMVDLGMWDGDGIDWPTDVSGDGIADFQFVDNAFLYAFGSYAGSYPPPLIMNIRGGKAVDVSTEPAFARLFEEDMRKAAKLCLEAKAEDVERNAVCAGYAADAARAGRLKAAWPGIMKAYDRSASTWPDGCRIVVRGQACPDAQTIHYRTYPEALTAFLKAQNYLK